MTLHHKPAIKSQVPGASRTYLSESAHTVLYRYHRERGSGTSHLLGSAVLLLWKEHFREKGKKRKSVRFDGGWNSWMEFESGGLDTPPARVSMTLAYR
jgi:hypothetical protein